MGRSCRSTILNWTANFGSADVFKICNLSALINRLTCIQIIKKITNDTNSPLEIWIEPFAFEIEIPVGETFTFISTSEEDGKYELVATEDGLTLWAWAGTDLLIKNGDSVVFEASLRFPNVEISKVRKLWKSLKWS